MKHTLGRITYHSWLCFWAACALAWVGLMPQTTWAAEGMWLPSEQPSLARNLPLQAVVRIDNCSGVFVSEYGLVMTSARCVDSTLAWNSNDIRNISEQGYLARSKAEELPTAPGVKMFTTRRQHDVTVEMKTGLHAGMSLQQYDAQLSKNEQALVQNCELAALSQCQVQAHQDGLHYLLVEEVALTDVRLVYVPPASVAHFGGEPFHWQWPQYGADVALLRVYNASGEPYQMAEHATISTQHYTFLDSVRVAGYPGHTQRFRTAAEMQWAFTEQYPAMLEYLQAQLAIFQRLERGNTQRAALLRQQVAYLSAQMAQYEKVGLQQKSEENQERLLSWLTSPNQRSEYREAWWHIQQQLREDRVRLPQQLWWHFFESLSLPAAAMLVYEHAAERNEATSEHLEVLAATVDPIVEQEILVYLLMRYQAMPSHLQLPSVTQFFGLGEKLSEQVIRAKVTALYQAGELLQIDQRSQWLNASLDTLEQSSNPWVQFAISTATERRAMAAQESLARGRLAFARPQITAAKQALDRTLGRVIAANANRTLRLSEGQIIGYGPDKNPDSYKLPVVYLDVFNEQLEGAALAQLPQHFRSALRQQRSACFMNPKRGSVLMNFISSADAALGSIGSPTFDAEGKLLGMVFDFMAESARSEWLYEREQHRVVHIDVRYLLWILAYYEQADALLAELGYQIHRSNGALTCIAN